MRPTPSQSSPSPDLKLDKVTTFLIDLDDTIYPASSGVWELVRGRLETYLRDRLGFDPLVIPQLRERLFSTYGTTLRGLQQEFSVDTDDYLNFVHDVQVEEYLTADSKLRSVLASFNQTKFIFTNANRRHARRVLSALGVSDLFAGIIDIVDLAPFCKPQVEAYQFAMQRCGEPDPSKILMIDDSSRNLVAAQHLGMQVIRVGEPNSDPLAFIPELADLMLLT